jgi:hypothetical protein
LNSIDVSGFAKNEGQKTLGRIHKNKGREILEPQKIQSNPIVLIFGPSELTGARTSHNKRNPKGY